MKVLIITYYWPPAGGSGVQRWLKFVKYLGHFSIEPIVYTVANPQYPVLDQSLLAEVPEDLDVLSQPIWEPNMIFNKSAQKKSAGFLENKTSLVGSFMKYVRANFFIPDARKFWIRPSVNYLTSYLKDHPVDAIITTGPPHSVHLIGLALKRRTQLKWLADFRDPWTEIDYFHHLPLTKRSLKKHKLLEKQVVQLADSVLVVGKSMADSFKKYNQNTYVITNGFDNYEHSEVTKLDARFSLVHIGMLNSDRNHTILWQALAELCAEYPQFARDLELKFIGKLTNEVRQSVSRYKLEGQTTFIDYVAHHEAIAYQQSAQVLLLLVNKVPSAKGIITGKIFEYLQARRPILAIAPKNGDLAEILNETGAGHCIDFSEKNELKKAIYNLYLQFTTQNLEIQTLDIDKYHRKNLTKELVEILKKL